jgi:LuxR family maltose regulon positive regulatory protein
MPKSAHYRVIWSSERTRYLISEAGSLLNSVPEDDKEWLGWFEEHHAFAFEGRNGHLNLLKERRSRGGAGYWYAYLRRGGRMIKRYVGRSGLLSLERLEALVLLLADEDHVISQPVVNARKIEHHQSEMPVMQFEPLLMTKLQLPRLQKSLLPRERLLVLLDRCLDCKLTVVAGPAGYGKTTLVGQWIASRVDTVQVAYVTLDESDNDSIRFWRYIIAACQTFRPGFGAEALELLRAHRLPPFKSLDMMLTVFLNELSQLEQPAVLVLDDFHVLNPSPIADALSFVLEHLPVGFHLIILIRGDPPFSLTRLRARNELLDIYPMLFAFTLEETRAFFEQELSFTLAPNALRQICARIGGWPTGLRLLAREINTSDASPDVESLLSAFAGSNWSIQDYFLNEVLHTIPLSLQDFLLRTCVLPLISVTLCDAVLGRNDSKQRITALHGGDLFLVSLDGVSGWSRYHSLFAEVLRSEAHRQLGDIWLRQLAMRASIWYEQHGLLAEAIETALSATEWKRASNLIKQFVVEKEQSFFPIVPEWYNVTRWLGCLPEAELALYPDLCLHYAILLLFMLMERTNGLDSTDSIYHLLQIAEQRYRDTNDTAKLADVFAFRALLAQHEGRILQAVTWAKQSLVWSPPDEIRWRTLSLAVVGTGELLDGNLTLAQDYLLEALRLCEQQGNVMYARAIRGMLSGLGLERSELRRTTVQFRQMLVEAREQEDRDDISHAQIGLAMIEYQWNHLQEAELAAQEAWSLGEQTHSEDVQVYATILLARIASARGKSQMAQQRLIAWLNRVQSAQIPQSYQLAREVQAALAQIQLGEGNHRAVERWFASIEHAEQSIPLLYAQREQLIHLRLLLVQGAIEDALAGLLDLQAVAVQTGHVYLGLEVQIVLALAYVQHGEERKAQEQLSELLQITSPEGYLRLFLDEGEDLMHLLRSHLLRLRDKTLIVYVRQIINLFYLKSGTKVQHGIPETLFLPDPLSRQEVKVLRLLVAGNSNAEIARELIVSVNTIRTQIQSIYRKLNVNSRVEASTVAHQLGVLEL